MCVKYYIWPKKVILSKPIKSVLFMYLDFERQKNKRKILCSFGRQTVLDPYLSW